MLLYFQMEGPSFKPANGYPGRHQTPDKKMVCGYTLSRRLPAPDSNPESVTKRRLQNSHSLPGEALQGYSRPPLVAHSLPGDLTYTPTTDSDSTKRDIAFPMRHRTKIPAKRTQSARNNPTNFAQELFDRTLERMTSNHLEDRGAKAKRTNPNRKGASLSTRSSLIYSSGPELSDTQDISCSESDVSLPS